MVILSAFAIWLIGIIASTNTTNSPTSTLPPPSPPAHALSDDLDLVKKSWSMDDYGRATHVLMVKNKGHIAYKDLVVQVEYYSKTKASLGTRRETIYEVFPPGKTVSVQFDQYTPAHAERSGVEIVSAKNMADVMVR